jgi:fused-like protein
MDAYHILERVGEGSFGKVYKGRRRFTGQFVALKFVGKHGRTEAEIQQTRSEINLLRSVAHPHVVRLLDFFETSRDLVIVTEFCHGQLYEVFVDDKRLPIPLVRSIAQQLCSALHYLHAQNIVHRDIKAQNVLIGSDGVLKLCDFGFARSFSSASPLLSSALGSPLCMAPEILAGRKYDASADLWALAVMLYELAAGFPPFNAENLPALMKQVLDAMAEGGRGVSYPDAFPPDFVAFLASILKRDPQQRATWDQILSSPFLTASSSTSSG